jgi:hypothetical protein
VTLSDTGSFALIPEWVLYSKIGDKAKLLYCVLGRYADKEGQSFPSRQRLAEHLDCTTKSVDRAAGELIAIGAIERRRQYNKEGDPTTNLWRVIRAKPSRIAAAGVETMSLGRDTDVVTPRDTDDATPSDTDVPLTRTSLNENHFELEKTRPVATKPGISFEDFWKAYPARRGVKKGKGQALARWKRLTADERKAAFEVLPAYARSGDYPKDAERWLRDKLWIGFEFDEVAAARARAPNGYVAYQNPDEDRYERERL